MAITSFLVLLLCCWIAPHASCDAQDDVWIVSSRHLSDCVSGAESAPDVRYFQLQGGQFIPSSSDQFQATVDSVPQHCVFVHGNRVANDEVYATGRSLQRQLACGTEPCRYVFWSWPSDRIPGLIRDAREKAERADVEAFYLARFLSHYRPEHTLRMVGYSFGARAVTGSLQLCAGGSLCGRALPPREVPLPRPRVALFAAAMPRNWLMPQGNHGLALGQMDELISFYNQDDPALKHFGFVFKPGKPVALGYEGIAQWQLGTPGYLVHQFDVTGIIGRNHAFERYVASPRIMTLVRNHLFVPPAEADPQSPALSVP